MKVVCDCLLKCFIALRKWSFWDFSECSAKSMTHENMDKYPVLVQIVTHRMQYCSVALHKCNHAAHCVCLRLGCGVSGDPGQSCQLGAEHR